MSAQTIDSETASLGGGQRAARITVRQHPPQQVAARLAQVMAEVLVRARPATQLEAFATMSVVRLLERRADPPVLATAGDVLRPTVHSLRMTSPRRGVVEVCAVIKVGQRHRALAYRIELSGTGWKCVAVQVG